jgi:hypothetical protein
VGGILIQPSFSVISDDGIDLGETETLGTVVKNDDWQHKTEVDGEKLIPVPLCPLFGPATELTSLPLC